MRNIFVLSMMALVAVSCTEKKTLIEVSNPAGFDREVETVSVDLPSADPVSYIIVDPRSGEEVMSQLIDDDGDEKADRIIFQVQLSANESRSFHLVPGESQLTGVKEVSYGRFVPERTDDFTWENDKVAFRTYGPEARRMVEEGIPGGTLSSGIDCWLKKVDYSIIDSWYKGYQSDPMYYHSDRGEGLDNYHVGPSRGCGGTGVMKDGRYYTPKNFRAHKTFFNGPVSASFELDYPPYPVGEKTVQERKVISIDLGSSLTKFVVYVEGADTLTAGVTLHENKGELTLNMEKGWISYDEPHFGEELYTGIVAHPEYFAGEEKMLSEEADASHGLLKLKVIDGKVEFYSGFYWSGSDVFSDKGEWEEYLDNVVECLKQPLVVSVR